MPDSRGDIDWAHMDEQELSHYKDRAHIFDVLDRTGDAMFRMKMKKIPQSALKHRGISNTALLN